MSGLQRWLCCALAAVCAASPVHADVEFSSRLKWFGTATTLPARDLERVSGQRDSPGYDQNLDLRLMFRATKGPITFLAETQTAWRLSESKLGRNAQGGLNQVVDNDADRVFDLTWRIDRGAHHASWQRFDRLALQYQQGPWSLTVGRQAVSWGNGLVFQPMDLFNPFTPTAVDTDYKPGSDIVLIERVTQRGDDLQILAVGRRNAQDEVSGRVGSLAAKWRGSVGSGEYELMFGRHFSDQVGAVALRFPLGGALLRTDIVATKLARTDVLVLSGVINLDYSFAIADKSAYVFAEYFYNGFGHTGHTPRLPELDIELLERIERGELFNLQRSYVALGANYQLLPRWTPSLTGIVNLHDGSGVVVGQVGFDPGDHQRIEFGGLVAIGAAGDEFGGPFAFPPAVVGAPSQPAAALTLGGANQAFVRWVYYW